MTTNKVQATEPDDEVGTQGAIGLDFADQARRKSLQDEIVFGKWQGIGTRKARDDVVSEAIAKGIFVRGRYGSLKATSDTEGD